MGENCSCNGRHLNLRSTSRRVLACASVAAGLMERGLVSSPDISEYTQYLEDKGLLRVIHSAGRFGIQERLLGLTPDGIDLLDGLRAAPGVEV